MAIDRKCDKCGATSASEIRVDIVMLDVVTEGSPTGVSFVTDACPQCRVGECDRLFNEALRQLLRDIPRHKELIANAEEQGVLERSLAQAVEQRDSIEKKDSPTYREAAVAVDKLLKAFEEKQARRSFVLDEKNYQRGDKAVLLTSGIITNPTANQNILDTGPLPAKERIFQVFFATTVADAVDVQVVAADGTTVRKSQILAAPTFGTAVLPPLIAEEAMAENERLRLRVVLGGTKYVSASLDYTA